MAEEQGNRMKIIGDLLTRDLSRKIEEIIQVDQADEQSVHDEISEYVATDRIREQYHHLFKAVAEAPADPHESVGVWVSGFFGSGKSSLAKNFGYALQNRTVLKPIGALVSLDKVFELVEGNLSNEKRTDIHQISERFKNDPGDHGWALRVAKAICLLEFIRDLPRTESNLAAVLVDEVGKATPVSEV